MQHTRIIREDGNNEFNSNADVLLTNLGEKCENRMQRIAMLELESKSAKGVTTIKEALELVNYSIVILQNNIKKLKSVPNTSFFQASNARYKKYLADEYKLQQELTTVLSKLANPSRGPEIKCNKML